MMNSAAVGDSSHCSKYLQCLNIIWLLLLIEFCGKARGGGGGGGGGGSGNGGNANDHHNTQDFQKNIPVRLIWAAQTKDIELPCDITSPIAGDSAKLILWFKDSTGVPLYSFDRRSGGSLQQATHSALANDLGQRLYFAAENDPKDARLMISNVKLSDGGIYRCRVDFFESATRNVRVNLTLVVPPDEPRIFDAQGKEIFQIAGPFREGHELFLSCQVTGGRPQPKVTWWRDGIEIAANSHPSADEGLAAMVNPLFMSTVTRDFYGSKLECRAQGSHLVVPVIKEVTVQVHLKPIKTKIVSANDLLIAGKSVPVRCETWGSFPPAKVMWLLDGEIVHNADVTSHTDGNRVEGNVTISILNLKVTSENDGAELVCRAANPWFSGSALEDKRVISVAYPPVVSVHLANEEPDRVVTRAEQGNITFKCRADSRPPVTSYSWYKNDMRMSGEITETLYVTQIQRESAGAYACGAQNSEGETRSSTIMLKVQFAPRCKPGTEQTSVGAINLHSILVKCEVEANPPESIRFSWTYNNTRNVSPVLNSRITSHGPISTMTYLPQSDNELITLACWASNIVGHQATPCLIHIIPAKTPEPPKHCELRNDTVLEVVCVAGDDGGLAQHFLLEVLGGNPIYSNSISFPTKSELDNTIDINTNEISTMNDQATTAPLRQIKETIPEFKLHDLEPGREYQFLIYAQNAKGKSHPPISINGRIFGGETFGLHGEFVSDDDPKPAETTSPDMQKEHTLITLAAIVAAGIIVTSIIIVAGIVVVCRHRPKPPQPQEVRKRMRPARTDVPSMYAEDDGFSEGCMELTRSADIRSSRSLGTRSSSRYIATTTAEGYVQYSQPSLNDPDLILPPAGEIP